MKFVSFLNSENKERLGLYVNGKIADLSNAGTKYGISVPDNILALMRGGEEALNNARTIESKLLKSEFEEEAPTKMLAPVPHPTSCRDAYAFRQHVAAARRNRGVEMIPEFDEFPIFYFTNHNAVIGEGDVVVELDHLLKLDFELEIAAVIGKYGKNVLAEEADDYIFGYTIMNDFSARQLQMEEMKLNLGPAKGKDFATAIGPWLVTPDELEQYKVSTPKGNIYKLYMKAFHNGKQVSSGNTKDITYTFAEIIERVSYGVEIQPGEVIGSGTVGTGCYLELNGTWANEAKAKGEDFTPIWLKDGDDISLEITGLGTLNNKIKLTNNDYSILSKKRKV
ncbi:fumarylacetoacetate hydrolase family protein [bacterium]|nr:MAG: fumarylacetoacetate hydrolase family protein [bacterium]